MLKTLNVTFSSSDICSLEIKFDISSSKLKLGNRSISKSKIFNDLSFVLVHDEVSGLSNLSTK